MSRYIHIYKDELKIYNLQQKPVKIRKELTTYLLTCCTIRYLEAKYARMVHKACQHHHIPQGPSLIYSQSTPKRKILSLTESMRRKNKLTRVKNKRFPCQYCEISFLTNYELNMYSVRVHTQSGSDKGSVAHNESSGIILWLI